MEQICEEYRAAALHLQIHCQLEHELAIYADATLVQRILRNLVDNAVKYTHRGEIRFCAIQQDDAVVLQLTDTGIGIPDDQLKNVFNEFHQLNNPERNRQKGLGLGLAIVKRLCALTGIDIELQSTEGVGTTAKLTIPSGEASIIATAMPESDAEFAGLKVVVIDDERDILDGMREVLLTWECAVVTATSGEQALLELSSLAQVPDILIVDFRLRDSENGLQVIERIWEEYNLEIPAILVTGDTAPDRILEADASGIAILYKPIESGALKEKIQSLLP